MKRVKYKFHPETYELGENEKFYSDMEAKGWRLVKRGGYLSKFVPVEPSRARWIMMGRCFSPSSPTYSSSNRSGICISSWMVPHCQVRPRESARWKSSLGP